MGRAIVCLLSGVILLLLAACGTIGPNSAPPHLDYTPGPPVIVTDETYTTATFSVRYPQGWRVITAAAFSTPWVVFITPDETALIALAGDVADTEVVPSNTPENELRRREQAITLANGETLTAVLVAPDQDWETLAAIFERVIGSARSQIED